MVKVEFYHLLDHTVCTVDVQERRAGPESEHTAWANLAYITGPPLAHSETDALVELFDEAIRTAEKAASERGGWSVLA